MTLVFSVLMEPLALLIAVQFHELGHSVAAWLTGTPAIPLIVYTQTVVSRSLLFACLFAAINLALGAYCWESQKRLMSAFLFVPAAIVILSFFLMSEEHVEQWVVAGGLVGQVVLPVLVFAAFPVSAPRVWRWDFWSYPIAAVAGVSL